MRGRGKGCSSTRSFQAADHERALVADRGDRRSRRLPLRVRQGCRIVEEIDGGSEEQPAGECGGEVKDAIGVAGRVTDEQVPNSPLPTSPNGMLCRTIFSSLPSSSSMTLSARCESAGFSSSSTSTSSSLVRPITRSCSDRQRLARRQVVHVLLHVDVARAGEIGILVADRGRADRDQPVRVLGSVHEAHQITARRAVG